MKIQKITLKLQWHLRFAIHGLLNTAQVLLTVIVLFMINVFYYRKTFYIIENYLLFTDSFIWCIYLLHKRKCGCTNTGPNRYNTIRRFCLQPVSFITKLNAKIDVYKAKCLVNLGIWVPIRTRKIKKHRKSPNFFSC